MNGLSLSSHLISFITFDRVMRCGSTVSSKVAAEQPEHCYEFAKAKLLALFRLRGVKDWAPGGIQGPEQKVPIVCCWGHPTFLASTFHSQWYWLMSAHEYVSTCAAITIPFRVVNTMVAESTSWFNALWLGGEVDASHETANLAVGDLCEFRQIAGHLTQVCAFCGISTENLHVSKS